MVGTVGKTVIPDSVPSLGGRKVEDVLTEWIDGIARTVARVGSKYGEAKPIHPSKRISIHADGVLKGIMGFHKVQQLRGKEKAIVEEEGANALRQGMKGINTSIRGSISETVSGVSIRNVMDGGG